MSDYQWSLRVTSTGGEAAHARVRRHQFVVGRPVHFDAEYPLITSLEYALGAIGAEIVNGLRLNARRARVVLDDVEALVRGEIGNPLTYLRVVGAEGDPGLSRIHVTLYVSSPAESRTIHALWDDIRGRLPLSHTFSASGLLEVTLLVVDG